jgi:hypothetical protein
MSRRWVYLSVLILYVLVVSYSLGHDGIVIARI